MMSDDAAQGEVSSVLVIGGSRSGNERCIGRCGEGDC